MNPIMFFDTETSGLPLWSQPSSDPGQPHIVQAAAVLVDEDTRDVISSFDLIARPNGWEIPDEVAEIHGITTERALQVGVYEDIITASLFAFAKVANRRIGHNQPFDARIVRIALKRFMGDAEAEDWKAMPAECTQKMSTPILKLPPTKKMLAAGRKHNKTANLSEAYEFFTGKPLEEAHTALADTLACMAVYFAIEDMDKPEAAQAPQTAESQPPEAETYPDDDGVSFL